VDVVLNAVRAVVVDYEAHVRNIQATLGTVGCDEETRFTFEVFHRPVSVGLFHITVEHLAGKTIFA